MSTIATAPIEIDEMAVAWIIGANTKVIEVALDHLAHGWSPEEIFFQHYGQLSLAQIHAALSYYYAHQTEFDTLIAQQLEEVKQLRANAADSPGRERLRRLAPVYRSNRTS
jgi:uncharacterized protein (DUF433 family)